MIKQVETNKVINLVEEVILPLFEIKRTMVMPFDVTKHENVGEHSLSLSLLACALAEHVDKSLDTGKIAEYAIVHDIVEIYAGDTSVWVTDDALLEKKKQEEKAAERLEKTFPQFPWIAKTYKDYDSLDTPEKRYVYALDKILPHILIVLADTHPVHPSWEEYKKTEMRALAKLEVFPALKPLFADLCLRFRQSPHFFSTAIPAHEE